VRNRSNPKRNSARSATGEQAEQFVFTVQADTGEFLRVEEVDFAGGRREISPTTARRMANKHRLKMIEAVLDEAFEAGISSMIEPTSDVETTKEASEEEAEVRKLLLDLIIGPEVRDHVRRRIINQLILDQSVSH